MVQKMFGPKKFFVQKCFGAVQILGLKNIWIQNKQTKDVGLKKVLAQNNVWSIRNLGSKNFGSK